MVLYYDYVTEIVTFILPWCMLTNLDFLPADHRCDAPNEAPFHMVRAKMKHSYRSDESLSCNFFFCFLISNDGEVYLLLYNCLVVITFIPFGSLMPNQQPKDRCQSPIETGAWQDCLCVLPQACGSKLSVTTVCIYCLWFSSHIFLLPWGKMNWDVFVLIQKYKWWLALCPLLLLSVPLLRVVLQSSSRLCMLTINKGLKGTAWWLQVWKVPGAARILLLILSFIMPWNTNSFSQM